MKQYNAIDLMRFVAALLVVCIHTYPLFDFSPTANYYLMYDSSFPKGFGMWFMLPSTVYFLFTYLREIKLQNSFIYTMLRP